jgi:hypothetical protein
VRDVLLMTETEHLTPDDSRLTTLTTTWRLPWNSFKNALFFYILPFYSSVSGFPAFLQHSEYFLYCTNVASPPANSLPKAAPSDHFTSDLHSLGGLNRPSTVSTARRRVEGLEAQQRRLSSGLEVWCHSLR